MKRLAAAVLGLAAAVCAAGADEPSREISPSERALFMTRHLGAVRPPATLRYTVRKAGSLEPGFEDTVRLDLGAKPDKTCCSARATFVGTSGRQPKMQVDAAEGNPVILYFLEHDIADMRRLTGGATGYFRKRIRLALAADATLHPVSFKWRGQEVAGQEIDISPFLDDPNGARFPKFLAKRYVFLLSAAVPGGVYGIRTQVPAGDAGLPPLLLEEMMVEGAGPPPSNPMEPPR